MVRLMLNSRHYRGDVMSVPEQSLITDEHRGAIGQKSEPAKVTIKEEDAKRMPDVLAGMGGGPRRGMPMVLPGGLLTQQEWKFSRPFKIGEELQAVSQVFDI